MLQQGLFCVLQLGAVYITPACAERLPAVTSATSAYTIMRVVACVLLQRSFYSRTCLNFYRSELSAGQERQEGLIGQVSSLEQAQAALQAEAAARPSDSFLHVPLTGQVGLVKPLAVMHHATMALHTHTCNVDGTVSRSTVNMCLLCGRADSFGPEQP